MDKPMPKTGAGERRGRPAAGFQAVKKMGANEADGGSDPGEMAIGAQGDHTSTARTAVTLQRQGFDKTVKITLNKTVSPDPPVLAAGTACRTNPGIKTSFLVNFLEIGSHCTYHGNSGV
jgi:hypothetical protein